MEINKEIFLTFLESSDWSNQKTYNLFERINKEQLDKIKKLEDDVIYFQNKFDEVSLMLKDTLQKYEETLQLCEKLKNKPTHTTSTQTFINNIKNTTIDYTICDKSNTKLLLLPTNIIDSKTISKLKLDFLWDEVKSILNDGRNYKEKNKDLIILFCDYKKEIIKLMGKIWYKKCVQCVENFGKINDNEHKNLYSTIISMLREIFDNDW